jgi:hypothetical protein
MRELRGHLKQDTGGMCDKSRVGILLREGPVRGEEGRVVLVVSAWQLDDAGLRHKEKKVLTGLPSDLLVYF